MWGLTKGCGIVGETVVLWVFVVCEVWLGFFAEVFGWFEGRGRLLIDG